jgi:CBS domain-containing protein
MQANYLEQIHQSMALSSNQPISSITFTIYASNGYSLEQWTWARNILYVDILPETIFFNTFFAIRPVSRHLDFTLPICNGTDMAWRDEIVAQSLLGLGLFAKNPHSVASAVYVCRSATWINRGDAVVLYNDQNECWSTSGDHFVYSGWHYSTILIVALTSTIVVLATLMIFGVYFMRIQHIDTQEVVALKREVHSKLRILRGYLLIAAAVIIISIIYETTFNRTSPHIVSDFFIVSWVLIGVSLPFVLYGLIKIFADNHDTWIPSGFGLIVSTMFIMWWVCCQVIGIVLEPYWSLPFFTAFVIIVGVILCALRNFSYQQEVIKRYVDERSIRWVTVQKNFWFLQWHLVELFIVFLVVVLILEIRVLAECFAMIQYASLGFSVLQSLLTILIGVFTLGLVLRFIILGGLDTDRRISMSMTEEIVRLLDQRRIEKHADWNTFPPTNLMPISLIFPSPRRSYNLLVPEDWTLENLRTEGPTLFPDVTFDGFSFLYNDIVISRDMEKIFLLRKLMGGKFFLIQDKQRLDEPYIGSDVIYGRDPSLATRVGTTVVDEHCPLLPNRDIE